MPVSPARARAVTPRRSDDLSITVQAKNTRIVGKFDQDQVSLQTTLSLADLKRAAGKNMKIASIEFGPPWNAGGAKLKVTQRGDSLTLGLDHGVNQAALRKAPPQLVIKLADGRVMLVNVKVDDVAVKVTGQRRATLTRDIESLKTELRALRADLATQSDPAAKQRLQAQVKQKTHELAAAKRELQALARNPSRDAKTWSADTHYGDSFGG